MPRGDTLGDLAEIVGLMPDWQDIAGNWHRVSPESLRGVLTAFGIQARSDHQLKAALRDWDEGNGRPLPTLLTITRGGMLTIPGRHHKTLEASIVLEGETRDRPVAINHANGILTLRAPRRIGYHRLRLGRRETILAVAPPTGVTCRDLSGGRPIWGLATQIYSLRDRRNETVGDFSALRMLATASAKAGASALALSPLHAQFAADGSHFSPYSPSSRLWLNVLYIDVDAACRDLLPEPAAHPASLRPGRGATALLDWPGLSARKLTALADLYQALKQSGRLAGDDAIGRSLAAFAQAGGIALAHHALFEALQAHFLGRSRKLWHWRQWPTAFRDPDSQACRRFQRQHADAVDFHIFLQWLASRQLQEISISCRRQMAIGLLADIAVGSDSGGSQAWARRGDMLEGLSIGSPPDDFNAGGQNWGITSFSPLGLRRNAYRPFIDLLRASLQYAGGIRLDHILGLARLWVIPDGARSTQGVYLRYPFDDLLRLAVLESHRHRAFLLGEDLGTVPPGFRERLRDSGIAGMQVLWFQRRDDRFLQPQDWSPHAVGMTTTHDLATVAGWWRGSDIGWRRRVAAKAGTLEIKQQRVIRRGDRQALWDGLRQAGVARGDPPPPDNPPAVADAAIAFLGRTACDLVIAPLEDLLGLPEQPNLPGTVDQHPNWRRRLPMTTEELFRDSAVRRRLRDLARQRPKP